MLLFQLPGEVMVKVTVIFHSVALDSHYPATEPYADISLQARAVSGFYSPKEELSKLRRDV